MAGDRHHEANELASKPAAHPERHLALVASAMHVNVLCRSIDPGVFREIDADTSNMITFLELEDEFQSSHPTAIRR